MIELDVLMKRREARAKEQVLLACLTGGLAASASYNAAGAHKKDGTVFTPNDFMPKESVQRETSHLDPEQLLQRIREWNAALGGTEVVN